MARISIEIDEPGMSYSDGADRLKELLASGGIQQHFDGNIYGTVEEDADFFGGAAIVPFPVHRVHP